MLPCNNILLVPVQVAVLMFTSLRVQSVLFPRARVETVVFVCARVMMGGDVTVAMVRFRPATKTLLTR